MKIFNFASLNIHTKSNEVVNKQLHSPCKTDTSRSSKLDLEIGSKMDPANIISTKHNDNTSTHKAPHK